MTDEEIKKREFNLRILADKKPYFMRYIYPNLINQYNTYIKNTNKKCVREFRVTIEELLSKDSTELSFEEAEFIKFYYQRMPIGTHNCVMNKICRRFESEFDGYLLKNSTEEYFDYEIMKSGEEYSAKQYSEVKRIFEQYTKRLQEYMQFAKRERIDEDECSAKKSLMVYEFKAECEQVCSNSSQLCDIILDLCYSRSGSKQFCWDICGEEIINNLLAKNNNKISYPTIDDYGDIEFGGKRFVMISKEVC